MLLGLCDRFVCFDFGMLCCVFLVGRLMCMGFQVWVWLVLCCFSVLT